MIGIAANSSDFDAVEEFFELFKTPWERAVPERRYRVAIRTQGAPQQVDAELLLIYSSREDGEHISIEDHEEGPVDVDWDGSPIPVYGGVALFRDSVGSILKANEKAVDHRRESGTGIVHRIGYDLFREVDRLLVDGQPALKAATPTLELHIALLRRILLDAGVSFVEIPSRPDGYDFTCCLTHDVDFFGIRRHKFDRTLAGFGLRASIGTLTDVVRGRRSIAEAARNWLALLSLPLVFVGALPDFWQPFEDYAGADGGRPATFFLLPFKGRPGTAPDGTVDPQRSAPYGVSDIRNQIAERPGSRQEIALHGIDAWRDEDAATDELQQIAAVTGSSAAGVRMHWLYFTPEAPRRLEEAGLDYDSTCGYNDAVGYRAGTSQVFRLKGTTKFLELPMSIMDSALFYPGRMGLDSDEALHRCLPIVTHAKRFGGTIVINWHDRSLAPERQWGRCYRELLTAIGEHRVWFATAGQAVEWFRWRRSIRFAEERDSSHVTVTAALPPREMPPAIVRIHTSGSQTEVVTDCRFDGQDPITLDVTHGR